jgi:hypothetical protein
MTPLFQKLNLGSRRVIHVLGAPDSFEPALALLEGVQIRRAFDGEVEFAIAFVVTRTQLDGASKALAEAAIGDALLWMAYPKATSKKYKCEFNRDTGWSALGAAGFEPVRQVAIDEDWSALRFRKVEYIKTMSRNPEGTLSQAGREKASRRKLSE